MNHREKISEVLAKARIQASLDEPTRPTTPTTPHSRRMNRNDYVPPLMHIATIKRLKHKKSSLSKEALSSTPTGTKKNHRHNSSNVNNDNDSDTDDEDVCDGDYEDASTGVSTAVTTTNPSKNNANYQPLTTLQQLKRNIIIKVSEMYDFITSSCRSNMPGVSPDGLPAGGSLSNMSISVPSNRVSDNRSPIGSKSRSLLPTIAPRLLEDLAELIERYVKNMKSEVSSSISSSTSSSDISEGEQQ